MLDLYQARGNTWYFKTKFAYMPIYKLNERDIIMLDAGMYTLDHELIERILTENDFDVKAIICTHAHVDHTGNCAWIKEKYGCEIIMPEYEAMVCESMYNVRAYSYPMLLKKTVEIYRPMVCQTDRKIPAGTELVEVMGETFRFVDLPGHSFYHVGIITPDDVFYVGDTLLTSDVLADTKMLAVKNVERDLESKRKIGEIRCAKYLMAHKGVMDEIDELIGDNIYFMERELQTLLDIINRPMTMSEIYRASNLVFHVHQRVPKYVLAEMMLEPGIFYLMDNGYIDGEINDYTIKYSQIKKEIHLI